MAVAQPRVGADERRTARDPGARGLDRSPSLLALVIRNSKILVSGDAVNRILRFGAALVLARVLGPSGFGVFNVAIAAAGVLAIVSSLGLPDVAGREVALAPEDAARISGLVIAGRVSVAALGGLALVAVVAFATPGNILLAITAVALAMIAGASLDWLLRAGARVRPIAIANGTAGAAALVTAGVVAATKGSPTLALLGFAAAECLAAMICWKACDPDERPVPRLRGIATLLRLSWPVAISAVAFYIYYANFDTLVLASFRSTSQAGVYSAAYRVFVGLNVVGAYVSYASFPFLARMLADRSGRERADRLLVDTAWRLVVYGLLIVGGAILIARPSLGLLFGPRYRSASNAFVLLCVALAWYSATYPVGYALIAERRSHGYMYGAVAGGALNIMLCFALIPWWGQVGAAVATLAAFAAAGVIWLLLRRPPAIRPLVGLLLFLTALAACSVVVPSARVPIGACVIAAAAVITLRIHRLGRDTAPQAPDHLAER